MWKAALPTLYGGEGIVPVSGGHETPPTPPPPPHRPTAAPPSMFGWRPLDRMLPDEHLPLHGAYAMHPWELVISRRGGFVYIMQRIELRSDMRWERYYGHVTIVKGVPRQEFRSPQHFTDQERDQWDEIVAELDAAFGKGREFSMFVQSKFGEEKGTTRLDECSWFDPTVRRFARAQLIMRQPEHINELSRCCRDCSNLIGELLGVDLHPRSDFHLSIDSAWTPEVIPVVPTDWLGRHKPVLGLEASMSQMVVSGVVWRAVRLGRL